ncbi:MAG TPA: pitrilysin family protein [Thermoanaerobaculia bacterium]|nr:pitrilysin family protein [Thermoanaerobaculia bacterium]
MRRISLVLAVLILASTPIGAQKTAGASAGVKFDRARFAIPHQKFVLDNGLTLLVHTDHSVPIVGVNLWYHVGSRNETRGKTGFAHLFEHFFFNGSENYPHGFREAMDDLGANNRNGTTSTDRTNFFEDVPVSALERTLYLEADRMGFLAGHISKEMLERERGVVQNEKRQGENQPYGRVFTNIVETIYPWSHPYSWSTIGKMEDLDSATLDDVKEWYRAYYGPNNAVISLAGDITPERALELVKKYFGGVAPGPPIARAEQWVPRLDRNIRETMEDRAPQSRIYRVYHLPGWNDPTLQHIDLFASVLSGSKSSPLDRRLVYEKELATQVSAGVWEKELASNLIVVATVKHGVDPAVVEREIDSVIAALVEKGPAPAELQRAQSRALSSYLRGIERLGGFGGRSDVLAESMTFAGSSQAYLDRLQWMAEATPAAVKAASKQWIGDASHYTMLVKPFPRLAAEKSDLDRSILPALGDAPEVRFPKVQRAELSNGLDVLLLERHTVPIVNMALAVDAGYAADPSDAAGTASLAMELMDEGTKTRDAFRIADELDALGARISTASALDLSLVRLQALPMNLRPSLEIFADVVLNPSFPQEMVDLEKKRRIADIAQEKANPNSIVNRVIPALLYGPDHAYGKPITGSGFEETVAAMSREDLAAWQRTWFRPNASTLIVTGDVTMDELLPALESAFGSWKPGETPGKKIGAVAGQSRGKVYLIDKPGAPQSIIVAAHVTEPGGAPDELAIDTVMRNFGGMATSRLNRNLRLDKHWSYGARGFITPARGPRPFLVVAPVQTDKTKESILEVKKEIADVAGERPVAGEEYASIMRNMTMRLPGRFETLSSLESAALELVNFGYPDDYWDRYAGNVRALTAEQLATAAGRYVRPEELTWIIIGDLAKVEEGIRALNLGEIVHMEAK